ncbi:MAG: hypothetical protein U1E62_05235 [Alsobacter sp.]
MSDEILAQLGRISASPKSFDARGKWKRIVKRDRVSLQYDAPLSVDGRLEAGTSLMISAWEDAWEEDIYAQITASPFRTRSCRIDPVEWRPLHDHQNSFSGGSPYAGLTLSDRWHPFGLNAPLGIATFQQRASGIAVPLPEPISNFDEMMVLCSRLWHFPDLTTIEPPPWSKPLL